MPAPPSKTAKFFADDTVMLRNANRLGVVSKTWQDIDEGAPEEEIFDDAGNLIELKPGQVYITWVDGQERSQVLSEDDLELYDRVLALGDICKKDVDSHLSGTVIEHSLELVVEHTFTGQRLEGVKGTEIRHSFEYLEGNFVIYNNWLGILDEAQDAVTVRLPNSSIVTVERADELEPPELEHMEEFLPDRVAVGQVVTTTKGNLRRGKWRFGAYDPKIKPEAVVVNVETERVVVRWICQNPMQQQGRYREIPEPQPVWEGDELQKLHIFRSLSDATTFQVGDRVVFNDRDNEVNTRGARRISREQSMGYDVNIFCVVSTKNFVRVLWQDLTESSHAATELFAWSNWVDEYDLYPNEYVTKRNETKVGVVHSVDPAARVAKVRWFVDPTLQRREFAEGVEVMSLYELAAHATAQVRRGDHVILPPQGSENPGTPGEPWRPGQEVLNALFNGLDENDRVTAVTRFQEEFTPLFTQATEENRANGTANPYDMIARVISNVSTSLQTSSSDTLARVGRGLAQIAQFAAPPPVPSNAAIDWFGEVVGITPDGMARVRLGSVEGEPVVERGMTEVIVVEEELENAVAGAAGFDEDDSEGDDWEDESEEGMEPEADAEGWVDVDDDEEMTDAEAGELRVDQITDVRVPTDSPVEESSHSIPSESAISASTEVSNQLTGDLNIPINHEKWEKFMVLEAAPSSHHFFNQPSPAGNRTFISRIQKEHKILRQSLPEGILVRTYEDRLDLLRVLIIGPVDTPTEYAPCVFDFQLPQSFPADPPLAYFHSWTNGMGRINPNLYEEGKVCLSLLGTWHSKDSSETWSPSSSILQVLVSLQALVLNREPYYNEAGFGVYQGTREAAVSSGLYSEKVYILARGFVKYVLEHDIDGFADELKWLYAAPDGPHFLKKVVETGREIVERSIGEPATATEDQDLGKEGVGRLTPGALSWFKRTLSSLEEHLAKIETA
ncbi:serine/threonine protein kinase [Saitoella coloradoensis]